jgi:hypothetical protein
MANVRNPNTPNQTPFLLYEALVPKSFMEKAKSQGVVEQFHTRAEQAAKAAKYTGLTIGIPLVVVAVVGVALLSGDGDSPSIEPGPGMLHGPASPTEALATMADGADTKKDDKAPNRDVYTAKTDISAGRWTGNVYEVGGTEGKSSVLVSQYCRDYREKQFEKRIKEDFSSGVRNDKRAFERIYILERRTPEEMFLFGTDHMLSKENGKGHVLFFYSPEGAATYLQYMAEDVNRLYDKIAGWRRHGHWSPDALQHYQQLHEKNYGAERRKTMQEFRKAEAAAANTTAETAATADPTPSAPPLHAAAAATGGVGSASPHGIIGQRDRRGPTNDPLPPAPGGPASKATRR